MYYNLLSLSWRIVTQSVDQIIYTDYSVCLSMFIHEKHPSFLPMLPFCKVYFSVIEGHPNLVLCTKIIILLSITHYSLVLQWCYYSLLRPNFLMLLMRMLFEKLSKLWLKSRGIWHLLTLFCPQTLLLHHKKKQSWERFILNKSMLAVTYLPVIFQVLTNSLADYCSSTFPGTEVKIIPLQIPDTFFFPFLNIGSIFAKIQLL